MEIVKEALIFGSMIVMEEKIKIGSGIFDIVIPIMHLFILFVHANQISYLTLFFKYFDIDNWQ